MGLGQAVDLFHKFRGGHTEACARGEDIVVTRSGWIVPAMLAGGWFLATATYAQDGRVQAGYAFAEAQCASCHAIGRDGESPLRAAPAFRVLHLRYPVETLAEALAEGIVTAHPAMPQFRLEVAQIGDLIAYLKSLER
jgi:mono/diheme cytochrome c family protein